MKCKYDGKDTSICFNCPFADCIRDDIDDDPNIKERYEKVQTKRERYRESYARSDERWQRKLKGLPIEPRVYKRKGNPNYQREYRAAMPDDQKERYRAWQREYQRAKRAREKTA